MSDSRQRSRRTWAPYIAAAFGAILIAASLVGPVFASDNKTPPPAAAQPAPAAATTATTNATLVTVNGKQLMQPEAEQQVRRMMAARGMQQMPPEQLQKIWPMAVRSVVQQFITRTVLSDEVARLKVEVAPVDIDAELAKITERLPADAKLEDMLAAMNMTAEGLRNDIAEELGIRKLLDTQTAGKTEVTPEEIAAYYEEKPDEFNTPEQVHARHILLNSKADDPEDQRQAQRAAADELRKKLTEGADFATVAGEHSDCPSGKRGGDLGTFQRGQMVKPFEDAAFGQEVDAIGPVIETRFGYHIIQVQEHEQAHQKTLEEASAQIVEKLTEERRNEIIGDYIEGLVAAADVSYPDQAEAEPAE